MEDVIAPISKELLKAELTEEKRLRMTNRSHNQIYIITAQDSPNTMKEIGRLREIAFRAAGGGTGKSMDIDEYDIMDNPYKQLIVWNPEAEEILGGYRYILGTDVRFDEHGAPILATAHMFNFSDKFLKDYLPTTIELGRSFVTLEYQSTRADSKGLFALDNLWDGLGALTVVMPNVKYFFGKVTMYPSYHRQSRDKILYFLRKHFADKDNLITPMKPLLLESDENELAALFCKDSFKEDYKILNCEIRKAGYNIPPAGECLYESQPYHAYVRYSHQLRFRRCGGNGYPNCRGRDFGRKAHSPHRVIHSERTGGVQAYVGSK